MARRWPETTANRMVGRPSGSAAFKALTPTPPLLRPRDRTLHSGTAMTPPTHTSTVLINDRIRCPLHRLTHPFTVFSPSPSLSSPHPCHAETRVRL